MPRRILSVFIGLVVWTAIWLGGNALVRATRPADFNGEAVTGNSGLLAGILLLSVVASVVAGYVAVTIARGRRMKAVWLLAIVNLVIGVFVQAGYWDVMPVWYHLVFLIMLVPGVVVGGRLRARATAVA